MLWADLWFDPREQSSITSSEVLCTPDSELGQTYSSLAKEKWLY